MHRFRSSFTALHAPTCLLLCLWLSACASHGPPRPPDAVEPPVAIVPLQPFPEASPETRSALALAQDTRRRAGTVQDPDHLLADAEEATRHGNNPRAQSLARQSIARDEGALEAQRTRKAAALLKSLYNTTNLSDRQLANLRAAEVALVRGDSAAALGKLESLKTATQTVRDYRIQRGDSLSRIAARESVYGNSLLWPLLWQANRDRIPNPNHIRAGQVLRIKPTPTVEEVVQAIRIARTNPSRLHIGRVRILHKH